MIHDIWHPLYEINIQEKKELEEWPKLKTRGADGVMVIVVGNGHGDTSSNPGRGWSLFT